MSLPDFSQLSRPHGLAPKHNVVSELAGSPSDQADFWRQKKSPANFWEVPKVTEIYISFWEDVTLRTLSGGFMCGSLWFNMFGL